MSDHEELEELSRRTLSQIREIQCRYQREVEPLIKILSDIEALRPPAPIFIDYSNLSASEKAMWDARADSISRGDQ